jgi:hypothetical protein
MPQITSEHVPKPPKNCPDNGTEYESPVLFGLTVGIDIQPRNNRVHLLFQLVDLGNLSVDNFLALDVDAPTKIGLKCPNEGFGIMNPEQSVE